MAKRKRRTPGTGAAIKEANGTWTARFPRLGGGYHVRRGFGSRALAEAWCDSLVALRDKKHSVGQSLKSVNDQITAWIGRESVERLWKAKMLADVEFKLGYVRPYLGGQAVGDVLPDDVDSMLYELGRDLAPTTIRQIRNYLFQVFEDARQRRYIAYNPVLKPARRKRPKQKPPTRLSPSQAAVLLIAAEREFYVLAWWFILCCGLRSGEVCGLRWADVDLANCILSVRQESTDLKGKPHIDTPKNDKTRDVPFPRALIPFVRLHLQRLTKRAERGLARGTWQDHGLVFPGKSGRPMSTTSLRHALKDLTDATRLPPVTTHMLRHTAGGLLKAASCPYDVLGAILGHAPPGVTGHYAPPPVSEMRPWVELVWRELAGAVEEKRREIAS